MIGSKAPVPAPSFLDPPTPQFLPRSGVGGQTVMLNGQNFNLTPVSVKFENTDAVVSGAPTATQIAAVVPADLVPSEDASRGVRITVTTPGGSVTSTDIFTVVGT